MLKTEITIVNRGTNGEHVIGRGFKIYCAGLTTTTISVPKNVADAAIAEINAASNLLNASVNDVSYSDGKEPDESSGIIKTSIVYTDRGVVEFRNALDDDFADVDVYDLTAKGIVHAEAIETEPSASPAVELVSSDCEDGDVGFRISCVAIDTESGAEDIDVLFQQQINGIMTVFLHVDADGDIDFQDRNIKTTGNVSAGSETIICVDDMGIATANKPTSYLISDGDEDEDTITLADGVVGQLKHFVFLSRTHENDSINITPTTALGFAKIVFNAPGEGCSMIYTESGWAIVGHNGGIIS